MRYAADISLSHGEMFAPGSIRFDSVVHLDLFHDPEKAVAWMPGGGLELTDTETELRLEVAEVPPIPAGDRALDVVRSGQATGLSVEFVAVKETREAGIRVIQEAVLHGIGIVKHPSYKQARVEARARRRRVWL